MAKAYLEVIVINITRGFVVSMPARLIMLKLSSLRRDQQPLTYVCLMELAGMMAGWCLYNDDAVPNIIGSSRLHNYTAANTLRTAAPVFVIKY
jgi:hypothetical protein